MCGGAQALAFDDFVVLKHLYSAQALYKLSMISAFLMLYLSPTRFVVGDEGAEILGTLFYIGLKM